jgi:peptide/nickel transport system substrate-binding protein
LKKLTNVNLIGGINACYEHWDTRVEAAPGQPEYTGIFKGHGGKGADLRKAFLLSVPREEINEKLIKPINPNAPILGSTFIAPGFDGYERLVANNGSAFYRGSQAELNAKATRLLRKHYPTAGPSNPVKVNVLVPGNNARRAAEFALAKANALKVGFDLVGDVQASWSPKIQLSTYDVQFFAYCPSAVTQAGSNANFQLGGGNNRNGINLPQLDAILNKLQLPMDNRTYISTIIAAERIIHAEGLTSGVFLHPAVTAVNKDLKGIKPSPLSDDVVWNWWEWSY